MGFSRDNQQSLRCDIVLFSDLEIKLPRQHGPMQLKILSEPSIQQDRPTPLSILPDVAESKTHKQTADPQAVLANDLSSVDQHRFPSGGCTPEPRSSSQTPVTTCMYISVDTEKGILPSLKKHHCCAFRSIGRRILSIISCKSTPAFPSKVGPWCRWRFVWVSMKLLYKENLNIWTRHNRVVKSIKRPVHSHQWSQNSQIPIPPKSELVKAYCLTIVQFYRRH